MLEQPRVAAAAPVLDPPARETPFLLLDPAVAVERFRALRTAFPTTTIHYAVKANPHPHLLARLARAGCCFDVASPGEAVACLAAGAAAGDILHSNPVARRADLGAVARAGVGLFVVDSVPEVAKIADQAPEARVLVRLATTGAGSDWPLSRKYGCAPAEAVAIATAATRAGLQVAGAAFHVGSQQRDPLRWDPPIAQAAAVFAVLEREGLRPHLLDIGGGLPADLEGAAPPLEAYAAAVRDALARHFGARPPQLLMEPGRGIVGDAGAVVATVIGVVPRGGRRWVYLDAGVFTGLVETLDEAIRYRLRTSVDGGPTGPVVLAGPTCDSADVLYERAPAHLPLRLAEGDTVTFLAAGAYTSCYSTVGFNGFAPLPTHLRRPGDPAVT